MGHPHCLLAVTKAGFLSKKGSGKDELIKKFLEVTMLLITAAKWQETKLGLTPLRNQVSFV